jgi:SAM-dependent methyltransferase
VTGERCSCQRPCESVASGREKRDAQAIEYTLGSQSKRDRHGHRCLMQSPRDTEDPGLVHKRRETNGRASRQFGIERRLARRLFDASREERRSLYSEAYDEFYEACPYLLGEPKPDVAAARLRAQLAVVQPFVRPGGRVAEIGSGAGHLAAALAEAGAVVTALEVRTNDALAKDESGVRWLAYDGLGLPLPSSSQDVVTSHQTLEHLHTEDAAMLAVEILRCLKPGGAFVCTTPNRILGPHDVSRGFSRRAEGLHLHEYTAEELVLGLRRVGFARVDALIGWRATYLRVPGRFIQAVETVARELPREAVQVWPVRKGLTGLLGLRIVAFKGR